MTLNTKPHPDPHVRDNEAKLDNQVSLNDFGGEGVQAVLGEILPSGEVLEGT